MRATLVTVNNVYATNILDPIMFSGDTTRFYSYHDIKTLFSTCYEELDQHGSWFTANRLLLNFKKTKYTFSIKTPKIHFFHKKLKTTYLWIYLTLIFVIKVLDICNKSIEKTTSSIKFLEVMLDEQIAWNDHINAIEKKTC